MKIGPCIRSFDGRTVLETPEITLTPGKICAVVGANGSGKSTFAKLLAGVLRTDGNARVLSEAVRTAYMPQKSYAFRLSTRANILLTGGGPERAAELMKALRIDHLAQQRATGLSGGETARMALARVLMQPCELLILDEPTASMDMESAILAEESIKAYCKEINCAVLMITHDLQQARRMADEVLFFYRGQVWESGPAEILLYAPERPETVRFLDFYGGPAEKAGTL